MAVYLITAREVDRVKIGYTNAGSRSRFNYISANSPIAVALEAELDGGREVEAELHVRFEDRRIKGEWFELCPAIEELISSNRIAPPKIDAGEPGTVDALVRTFGGAGRLSRLLGIPMTTVATWRQRNSIPRWRLDAINNLMRGESPLPASEPLLARGGSTHSGEH